jgi:transposase-like protein
MPKKKPDSNKQTSVRVGNISDISGNVNVAGANITTHHTVTGLSAGEIKQLFDELYSQIDARANTSPAAKEDIKAEVKEIQSTVTEAAQKNEKIDESFLSRRFRNIARMAPDLLDVVVATLANPLAGLGVAAKKIAEKAKEETKQA